MIAFYYFAELLILESHSAELPGTTERAGLTVTLLSCVRTHEATWQAFRDKAAQLQASIECALPATTVQGSNPGRKKSDHRADSRDAAGERS